MITDGTCGIIAGHGRVMAAQLLGMAEVPCLDAQHLSDAQRRAYVIADNKLALDAEWDDTVLRAELDWLTGDGFDITLTGFSLEAVVEPAEGLTEPDDVPEALGAPVSVPGDVWLLGNHRVMCGDSTSADEVSKLMDGQTAALVHADPPYGMGKQSEGVQNDNLYRADLDAFQMRWWRALRPHVARNASAYVWGNAPDLWRLWYVGGLSESEELELRNEIVWDKKSTPGMAAALMTQYPTASERCLHFQIGDQLMGAVNADQYWSGWDVVRHYLEDQVRAVGLTPAECRRVTGVQMYSHWFSKSQWTFVQGVHYIALRDAYPGHFLKPYSELREEYETARDRYKGHIESLRAGVRSYFDNSHDAMRDVWEFPRVVGDERHGHATPKPVGMMERVMRTSLPEGGLCCEPFGGSGSTLMGAERTGRRCYTMELTPAYVDVIVRRWQDYNIYIGGRAIHADTGVLYDVA